MGQGSHRNVPQKERKSEKDIQGIHKHQVTKVDQNPMKGLSRNTHTGKGNRVGCHRNTKKDDNKVGQEGEKRDQSKRRVKVLEDSKHDKRSKEDDHPRQLGNCSSRSVNHSSQSVNCSSHSVNHSSRHLNGSSQSINRSSKLVNCSLQPVNQFSQSANHSYQSENRSSQSVNHSSQSVNRSSQSVNRSSQSVNRSSQSVNRSSQSVNRSSQLVNRSSQSVNHSSQSVNHSSQSVNHSSQSINHSSQSANHSSQPVNHTFSTHYSRPSCHTNNYSEIWPRDRSERNKCSIQAKNYPEHNYQIKNNVALQSQRNRYSDRLPINRHEKMSSFVRNENKDKGDKIKRLEGKAHLTRQSWSNGQIKNLKLQNQSKALEQECTKQETKIKKNESIAADVFVKILYVRALLGD